SPSDLTCADENGVEPSGARRVHIKEWQVGISHQCRLVNRPIRGERERDKAGPGRRQGRSKAQVIPRGVEGGGGQLNALTGRLHADGLKSEGDIRELHLKRMGAVEMKREAAQGKVGWASPKGAIDFVLGAVTEALNVVQFGI